MNDCDSLLTEIDKVLVSGVGGESSDVQVGPAWIGSYNYDCDGDGDNNNDNDNDDDDNLDKESPCDFFADNFFLYNYDLKHTKNKNS